MGDLPAWHGLRGVKRITAEFKVYILHLLAQTTSEAALSSRLRM